jgi:hypothetical protein
MVGSWKPSGPKSPGWLVLGSLVVSVQDVSSGKPGGKSSG